MGTSRTVKNIIIPLISAIAMVLALSSCATTTPRIHGNPYSEESINLAGDWHFKVHRKYSNMYQYLPYGKCSTTWEDSEAAVVPSAAIYETWETVAGPAEDYSTGGLQQMYRTGNTDERTALLETDLFPKWSEAWYCRTIDIPEGFIVGNTVTLLLGIIDDLDVVYVNGIPVAASGFKKADGSAAAPTDAPDTGGFDQTGDFQFAKSYWEVPREYAVDSSCFRTGRNEIAIRIYNNNSFGGFYNRPMALVSTQQALRYLKGLPTEELPDATAYQSFVENQITALETKNLDAYSASLSDGYNENGLDKKAQVAAVGNWFASYETIEVEDSNAGFYTFNGSDVYSADRIIVGINGTARTVLYEKDAFIEYFVQEGADIKERGNWSHCYTVSYTSTLPGMNGSTQKYSIYLPPSYYTDITREYPVVYLLHGINSTGESFVNVDKVESHMNAWIDSGDIVEMIVVMPNAGKSCWYEDTEGGPSNSAGPWASFIYVDILDEVESHYRTKKDAKFRGLSGISMGGNGVFKIGLTHTDIYTSFASHMGAVPDITPYFDKIDSMPLSMLDFYLDCGRQDQMVSPSATQTAGEYLEGVNANVTWELRDGAHNSAFYMTGMPKSMKMHSDHFIRQGLN